MRKFIVEIKLKIFMINWMPRVSSLFSKSLVLYKPVYSFSKLSFQFRQKKVTPGLSIGKSSMDTNLGGFLIYSCDKTRKFQFLSYAFIGFAAYLTGMIWLLPDPIYSIHQKISLGIVLVGMGIYQLKLRTTLKRMIMDPRGEVVKMQFYNWLGFKTKARDVQIPSIKGIRKLHPYLKIPTFVYNNGIKDYLGTFSSSGIRQRTLFPSIMSGHCITVIK